MKTVFLSLIGAFLFYLRAFVKSPTRIFQFLLIFLMVFHLMDVYVYAYQQFQLRSFPLTQRQYALVNFGKIPFSDHRSLGDSVEGSREEFVHSLKGSLLDSFNNFSFSDFVKPVQRSDYSLKSIESLFETFNNEKSPILSKLSGSSEDKLQFFTQAHLAPSDKDLLLAMKNNNYAGDLLFYQSSRQEGAFPKVEIKNLDLSQNQRVKIPYQITSFSPNEIIIKADVSNYKGIWLEYCDLWHPSWKAEINGDPREVYIGNLAYKALPLRQGMDIVRFYIESKPVAFLYYFLMYSSLVWTILLFCLLIF